MNPLLNASEVQDDSGAICSRIVMGPTIPFTPRLIIDRGGRGLYQLIKLGARGLKCCRVCRGAQHFDITLSSFTRIQYDEM